MGNSKKQSIQKEIHGFTEEEIFNLYKFLCIYESVLSKMPDGAALIKKYTTLKGVKSKIKRVLKPICLSKTKITNINDTDIIPDTFYYSAKKGKKQEITVLLHLRDAIAHGLIEKCGNYISIRDFDVNTNEYTAKGYIECKKVFDIINIINKNVNL